MRRRLRFHPGGSGNGYVVTVDRPASVVLEFEPRAVFPYYYRGKNLVSDPGKFRNLVGKDKEIDVRLLKWYK